MKYIYTIELWNPKSKRYGTYWTGTSLELAEKLMNKSYYSRNTRRLIRHSAEILYTERAKANK